MGTFRRQVGLFLFFLWSSSGVTRTGLNLIFYFNIMRLICFFRQTTWGFLFGFFHHSCCEINLWINLGANRNLRSRSASWGVSWTPGWVYVSATPSCQSPLTCKLYHFLMRITRRINWLKRFSRVYGFISTNQCWI